MSKTLAVFGAGPALGLSVARRFGREGYRVALVARDPAKLADLDAALRADRVSAACFVAELIDLAALRGAAETVVDRFGTPDVVFYGPGDVSRLPVSALDLDAEELRSWLPLNLLAPVALVRAVLPAMLVRGSGALLFAQGAAAREPVPALASSGVAQAGLLHYLSSLAAQVGPRGIRVGSLLIGALIERSAAEALWDGGHFAQVTDQPLPRVDPDRLAERYWLMAGDRADGRARVELLAG